MAGMSNEGVANNVLEGSCWAESDSARSPGFGDWAGQLARTIEAEIIPRLLLTHVSSVVCPAAILVEGRTLASPEVAEFVNLVLSHDASVATTYVEAMCTQGASRENIYLNLLAPAARRLGELWENDLCDFTQVTVGLWRIQQVLYELGPGFRNDLGEASKGYRALLVPAPGEQHTLGLFMVAEFFRRAGWEVSGEPPLTGHEITKCVRDTWFELIGLSVGCECRVDSLSHLIRSLRQASMNRAIVVMVGGPAFIRNPGLSELVGADAVCTDARQAAEQANTMVGMRITPE